MLHSDMKKFVALSFIILCIGLNIRAQTGSPNIVKLDALSIFISEFIPSYEFALSPKESVQFSLPLSYKSTSITVNGVTNASQSQSLIGVYIAYRRYVMVDFPERVYVAPAFEYRQETGSLSYIPISGSSANEESTSGASIGGSLTMGYQWVLANNFTMDLYWGIGHYISQNLSVEIDGSEEVEFESRYSGTRPKLGFLVGYNF